MVGVTVVFMGVWQTITITSRKPPWSNQWLYLTKKKHGKYMSVNWWWWRVGCTLHYLCCLANYGNLSKPFIFWGFGNQPKMDFWFRNCGHLRRFTYTWIVCRPSFAFTHHTLLLAPMFLPHIYIFIIYIMCIYISFTSYHIAHHLHYIMQPVLGLIFDGLLSGHFRCSARRLNSAASLLTLSDSADVESRATILRWMVI